MKLVQLLTGTAAAALLAGASFAQAAPVDATGGAIVADGKFASEYNGDIAATALFAFDTDNAAYDDLGASAVVDIVFTFTGIQLAEIADSNDFATAGVAANCGFAIQSGGGDNSTAVTYRSVGTAGNPFRDCADDSTFDFDLERLAASAGADASVNVAINCQSDCQTFANQSSSITLIDETDAYPASGRDVTAAGTVTLNADGVGPIGPHVLGNVDYTFRNTDGTAIQVDGDGLAVGGLATITNADAVASGELVVTFPAGRTGVATVTVTGTAIVCAGDAGANTFTCPLTAANVAELAAAGEIAFTSDNTNPIAAQTPTVALSVTSTADYSAPASLSGSLADIDLDNGVSEVVLTGPAGVANANLFPWTNLRAAGGTQSNFRVTGLASDLAQDSDEGLEFQLVATAGEALPSAYTVGTWVKIAPADLSITSDGAAANRWSATFNSTAIANALGITTEGLNGNVRFRAVVNDAAEAATTANGQIDRLLIKNGIVTAASFDG